MSIYTHIYNIIYSTMTLSIKGTDSATCMFFIYSTVGTTCGFIFLDIVVTIRKQHTYLRFSEVHVLHSSSPSLAISTNSNPTINHFMYQFYLFCAG